MNIICIKDRKMEVRLNDGIALKVISNSFKLPFIFTECAHAREVQFMTIHSRIVANKMAQAINCDFCKKKIVYILIMFPHSSQVL